MRGIERRLAVLEVGAQATTVASPADVAATALWLWGLAGEVPPNRGDLVRRAKGGLPSSAALRRAVTALPDRVLRMLDEKDMAR